jgi:hypothetical protein
MDFPKDSFGRSWVLRETVMSIDRGRMLYNFRRIKLLVSWSVLGNFLVELACALYLGK